MKCKYFEAYVETLDAILGMDQEFVTVAKCTHPEVYDREDTSIMNKSYCHLYNIGVNKYHSGCGMAEEPDE